ncbi:starch synthase [Ruminococcus sp. YRD2003]|uniref:glycogen synthase GlgA n=1 Tax=Ruminococcus sp. YRD2003 TaxID=1452313 RepID=UPI0008C4715C|nr:starch synthase [Ruminococcus flavefaciens]
MKILFAASEAVPYAASGGLADVVGSLPKAISAKGHECAVVIPLYQSIKPELRGDMEFVTNITVDVSWRKQYCGIYTAERDGVTYFFIDNEYYFQRVGLYGFYDDCERFVFFDRAVLEMLKYISFKPDIINCNDWQTALIPVYYQIYYKYQQGYDKIKTVFTIHNIEYQGKYGKEVLSEVMGIPSYNTGLLEYDGYINMLKGALETSDKLITVSPSYAWEILDPWYAHGLDRILVTKQYKLQGIMNGIDTKLYDPAHDPCIAWRYTSDELSGKVKCKAELLSELGMNDNGEPLIGIVTRFVRHKGIDLIRCVFEEIVRSGVKFAVLGSGEKMYEDFFLEMARRYPERVSVNVGFIPELSHKIYAGADMFLMPSQSEPCGLAQMIAMRYGTIPIVRETGGLRDSVRDNGGENGNGFTFKTYNAFDMLDAVWRAKRDYYDSDRWEALVKRAMSCDFSWSSSADTYIETFEDMIKEQ